MFVDGVLCVVINNNCTNEGTVSTLGVLADDNAVFNVVKNQNRL